MSTYERLLREAAGVSATPETPLPRAELLRAIARMHSEMMDLESDADKQLRMERLKHLEAWSKAAGNEQGMLAKLEETRGKNRRTAIMALQNDVANIRDNFTQLADTVNPALQRSFNNAALAGNTAAAAGNKDAAAKIAWSSLLGDLMNAGEVNEANLQLHTLFAQMERAGFGSVQDLQKNPEVDPNSNLAKDSRTAAEIAEAAYANKIAAQIRMQDSLGGLGGIITTMANSDTNANLDGLIQQASGYINTFYGDAKRFEPKAPTDAANDLNVYLTGNDAYQEHREAVNRLEGYLKGPDGTDLRQQVASVIGDPNFRDWAAANGWKIGKAQIDPETGKWLYVQGRDDARALRTYEFQLKHDPQQLLRDYNTKTWVAVTTRGSGDDVQLTGAVSMPLLQMATGGDPAAPTPLYASTTNEAGETVYLTGEQLDAIVSARESALPTPLRIFQHAAGRTTDTYLYDPTDGAIYEDDAKTGKWAPSKKTLAELGQDTTTIDAAPPAVVLASDGSYFAVNRADLDKYPVVDTVPASLEEFSTLQGEEMKRILTDVGVNLSTEPPPAPTYVTYGKLIRRHATDPQGSIRVSTLNGETLLPPEEILKVEETVRDSATSPLDLRDRLRGLTNERIATRLPHPTGEYNPNVADRIAATAEGRRVTPLPGPKVSPAVVAGQERVNDGFGTGTFMDTPDLVEPNIPAVATMSGFPTPTPIETMRGTRTLSDEGDGTDSALRSALAYRAGVPVTPPPVNSRSDMAQAPIEDKPADYVAQGIGRRIADSYPERGPGFVDTTRRELPPKEEPSTATPPATSPTTPTPPSTSSDPEIIAKYRAMVERTSKGTKTVDENGYTIDVVAPPAVEEVASTPTSTPTSTSEREQALLNRIRAIGSRLTPPASPPASPPSPSDLEARRAHVESASGGTATVDEAGFVVAKDGSEYITDKLYSSKKKLPYEKFVEKYPVEMTPSSTPSSTPPAASPATPPPSKPNPPTRAPPLTAPEPGSLRADEIRNARPLIERMSKGASTVDEMGVVVPVVKPVVKPPTPPPTSSATPPPPPPPPPTAETRYPQWNNRTLKEQQDYLRGMTQTSAAGVRARSRLQGDDEEYEDVELSDLPAWMTDPTVPPPWSSTTPTTTSTTTPTTPTQEPQGRAPTPTPSPWETVLKRRPANSTIPS